MNTNPRLMESVGGSTIFSTTKLKDLVSGAFSAAAAPPEGEGFGAGISGDVIANTIRLPSHEVTHTAPNQTEKEVGDAHDLFSVLSQVHVFLAESSDATPPPPSIPPFYCMYPCLASITC